eukprot:1067963-Prymnesium_polylepis.1
MLRGGLVLGDEHVLVDVVAERANVDDSAAGAAAFDGAPTGRAPRATAGRESASDASSSISWLATAVDGVGGASRLGGRHRSAADDVGRTVLGSRGLRPDGWLAGTRHAAEE